MRLAQRHFEKPEGLIALVGQRLERALELIEIGIEGHLHGKFVALCLERRRIEIACSFIHHTGDEIGGALLAGRIIGRSALKGELHGNERVGVVLDQPGGDAGLALHFLDRDGFGGQDKERDNGDCRKQRAERAH